MSTIRFDREALLHFYDDCTTTYFESLHPKGHVSGITGMIGEALMIGLLCNQLTEHCGYKNVKVLDEQPKEHGRRGKQLDAWIAASAQRTLFQVEVKNWCAHSRGGHNLAANADDDTHRARAMARWKEYFGSAGTIPKQAGKILLDYPIPSTYQGWKIERVLCFWDAIAENGTDVVSRTTADEKPLLVFSGSNFLRALPKRNRFVSINSQSLDHRLRLLHRLCQLSPAR
jgi:hypothetical protein